MLWRATNSNIRANPSGEWIVEGWIVIFFKFHFKYGIEKFSWEKLRGYIVPRGLTKSKNLRSISLKYTQAHVSFLLIPVYLSACCDNKMINWVWVAIL